MTTTSVTDLTPWDPGQHPPKRSVPVSVIVLTWNEEVNIGRCLRTVQWAKQVIVVDSGSTDRTVEIASSLGAKVLHHPFEDYGAQRQWAMTHPQVEHDWVFFVDADEWVPADLAAEVAGVVRNPRHDAYAMRMRLVWQGRWIRHAGWYGAWKSRLANRHRAQVVGTLSEQLATSDAIGLLTADIVDEDLKPFSRWLDKHNQYSSLHASHLVALRRVSVARRLTSALRTSPKRRIPRELAKQLLLPHLPLAPIVTFLYLYIIRMGFLDGRQGLWFCTMRAAHQTAVMIKLHEIESSRQDLEQ